jgi:hypothetical protein
MKKKLNKVDKLKLRIEYWDAIGNNHRGYWKRKDLMFFLSIGAIPIFGQLVAIYALILGFIQSRTYSMRIPKKYKWRR